MPSINRNIKKRSGNESKSFALNPALDALHAAKKSLANFLNMNYLSDAEIAAVNLTTNGMMLVRSVAYLE